MTNFKPILTVLDALIPKKIDLTDTYLTVLNYLGMLKVSGPQAKKFLQGQLTADLEKISPTKSSLSAHCNPQGRIISLFRLFLLGDDYYLQMPKVLIPIALTALNKYAIFFKVELCDVSADWICAGYKGKINQNLLSEDEITIHASHIILHKDNRYEILGKCDSPSTILPLLEKHYALSSPRLWRLHTLQLGIPTIYPETSQQFLPHDLNLPALNAVSFTKGCFTGQEIIARMHYKAKLKKRLLVAEIILPSLTYGQDFISPLGTPGQIVDFCKIQDNHYRVLYIT